MYQKETPLDMVMNAEMIAYPNSFTERDQVELHDFFATAEILHYENLGLCADGEAGKMIDQGESSHGDRIPVNVSGGLLSKGHPPGRHGRCEHLRGQHPPAR